jgi:hypothetical protein
MEQMACFLSGPSLHCPCDRWNPRYLTISWQVRVSFRKPHILSSTKGREGGEFLSYNPPELVQPTEGHLHTGGVCSHAGRPRKPLDQKPGQSQRLWESFWSLVATEYKLIVPFLYYWKFTIARQRWVGSMGLGAVTWNIALAGIRLQSMYGIGTTRCKVTVAELLHGSRLSRWFWIPIWTLWWM